jgi:heme-degrading monooxygenase HmoA
MFIIVFESTTPPEHEQVSSHYYTKLSKLLPQQPGFISETPFESVSFQNWALLVAKFTDEAAAHHWRINSTHLQIQKSAREKIFTDFRVRVGPELSPTGIQKSSTEEAPLSSQCRPLLLLEYPENKGTESLDLDALRPRTSSECDPSITTYKNVESILQILTWETEEAATKFGRSMNLPSHISSHWINIVREYGKNDRREAPPVEGQ